MKTKEKNTENHSKLKRINVYDVIIITVLIIFACMAAYPIIYTIAGSFSNGIDFTKGGIWLFPRKFTLANYSTVLSDTRLYRAFFNTVVITCVNVFLALVYTSCVAYAMSQRTLKMKKFFWIINMITMFFGGGLVPYYMIIRAIGLFDSFFVYIIPCVYSVYNMIVFTGFFKSIGSAIRESALLDGASEFRIWWSLYLPVSTPVLATIGLWIAVGNWNSYMSTLIYTKKDESMWTLQFYLMKVIKDSSTANNLEAVESGEIVTKTVQFATIVVSVLPICFVYPFVAKHFTKGIMIGAIKG